MKLLLAECCMSLVVPANEPNQASWCPCGQAAIWWDDPISGRVAIYSRYGWDYVSVIGLHNGLLRLSYGGRGELGENLILGDQLQQLLFNTPENYLFKRVNSLVIRFRPGYTGDSRFVKEIADVPQAHAASEQLRAPGSSAPPAGGESHDLPAPTEAPPH